MLGNWGQGMPHGAWKSLLTRHGKVFCTLRPHECKDLSLVGLKVVKVGYLQIRALRFTHRLKKAASCFPYWILPTSLSWAFTE